MANYLIQLTTPENNVVVPAIGTDVTKDLTHVRLCRMDIEATREIHDKSAWVCCWLVKCYFQDGEYREFPEATENNGKLLVMMIEGARMDALKLKTSNAAGEPICEIVTKAILEVLTEAHGDPPTALIEGTVVSV